MPIDKTARNLFEQKKTNLCLYGVVTLEHVVDVLEVVDAASNLGHIALGLVVLLQMRLVAEVAHLHRD